MDVLGDPTVRRIASRHNRSTAQIALRWVLQHGMTVVTSAASAAYQEDDLGVFDEGFELSAQDMAVLDAV